MFLFLPLLACLQDTNTERHKDTNIPLTVDTYGRGSDLRRTLAELSMRGSLSARTRERVEQNDPSLVEEQEESEGKVICLKKIVFYTYFLN